VGVKLPHSSSKQYRIGKKISKSQLRNGDLVFFYRGISHVGLYAGNGKVIHAPRPGKKVSYIKMSYMPYAGARRPADRGGCAGGASGRKRQGIRFAPCRL
jgi:hypothetical protein